MDCIICRGSVGKLTVLGKKGLLTILECSKKRGDESVSALLALDHSHYVIHEKCRKTYLRLDSSSNTKPEPMLTCESGIQPVIETTSDISISFNWEDECFICAKSLKMKDKKGNMKRVSEVSVSKTSNKESLHDKIMSMCTRRTDELAAGVYNRISSVGNLMMVNARYHRACLPLFMVQHNGTADSKAEVPVRELYMTESVPCGLLSRLSLPPLVVDSCGAATSHQHYLYNFASVNNLQLVDTIGGGNCFFDAVRQCLVQFGLIRTVRELRLAAALELNLNSELYSYLYRVEQEAGQHVQAVTYDDFVRLTREGQEWATQITVAAMAKSTDVVIRLISTDTDLTGNPTAFMEDYSVGVRQVDRSIIVGFNKHSAHYVGFIPVHVNTDSSSTGDVVIMDTALTETSAAAVYSNVDESFRCLNVSLPLLTEDNGVDIKMDVSIVDEVSLFTPVSVSLSGQCENCMRVDTTAFPLHLHQLTGAFTRRYISLLKVSDSYLLCSDCRTYLEVDEKLCNRKLWISGWPSVIAYLLQHPKHTDICSEVWNILPLLLRKSWSNLAASAGLSIAQEGAFRDFTAESVRYDTLTRSGVIADFVTAMDETCFPCVKCPAGCFAYIEECDAIAFNHFLAWKFGLSVFSGDRELLNGARADWPMTSLELNKFVVTPGLVVNENGLSVLLCRYHGGSLRKAIVHVPRHPILGNIGFQLPDLAAAAVLTPNVLRRGRLGKWTNSSHVINAVGGYGGISSSSIAQQVDNTTVDDRLAAATFLAVNNREDVYRTIQQRYSDMPNGNDQFQHDLLFYDRYLKPVPEESRKCLMGGSVVLVNDVFAMHNRFFDRDTKDNSSVTGSTNESQEKSSISLLFVIVHPPNDHGHHPFDTSSVYPLVDAYVLIGTLLRLVMHCPSVHGVLLKRMDMTGNVYLGKFLRFIKNLVSKSVRVSAANTFRDIKDAQHQTLAEIRCLKLFSRPVPCQMVAEFLSAIAPDHIKSYVLPFSSPLDGFVVDSLHTVVVIYRLSNRTYHSVMPLKMGQHRLMAAFGERRHLSEFHFRWNFDSKFWKVTRNLHTQSSEATECEFKCPQWQLLVYVNIVHVESMNKSLCKSLGGQEKMRCTDHHQFLVKQSIHCKVKCCVKNCDRNGRWCCLARGLACSHAVCFSHGRDILRCDVVVDVEQDIEGRRLTSGVRLTPSSDVLAEDSSSSEVDSDAEIFAPVGQEEAWECSDDPSLHSRRDMIPIYDVNRRIPGHYLWNKAYGVLRRRHDGFTNVQGNSMMQHIVSMSNSPCVSLLYPEGQLFPRIFWSSQGDAVVGAIPSFMLNCFSNVADHGIASLNEHHAIRMKDGDLLTSKQNSYWHYVFDLMVNQQLTRYSSKLVFKRGLEFLLENNDSRYRGNIVESKMPMDEAEATRRIKELACLLKKGKWTYFITITINESETPGVREITRAIKLVANGDAAKERELTDAYLPFVLRMWERFVRVLLQELLVRNHAIIGKVHHMFYRFEFQGAGAQGNKPHVHMGVTLEQEIESISLARICCSSVEFASRLFGTDFATLHNLGVVKDEADYATWCTVFSFVNTHDCNRAGGRCMKATNKEGEAVCRYRRQPPMPWEAAGRPWFETINVPYSEEVYVLLQEMGLASKSTDNWILDESLTAGKWHYRARSDEFFMASIPLLSAITRSATNVDMCDRHFQVSYLVKYVSGKEEHQLVDVAGSKNIDEVKVTTEEHSHDKITSCTKIMQKKEELHKHLGREISLAEVVWFVLGFQYTYCTASFVHVPTLPLAYRAAVRKHVSAVAPCLTVHEKRVAAGLPVWRQFTESQQAHVDEYSKSSLCLDTASAFNIRPAELIVFDDLQLYNECFVAIRIPNSRISCDLAEEAWLDGAGRTVKLHSCSLDKCLNFLTMRSASGNVIATQLIGEVFEPLKRGNSRLEKIFVKHNETREVVSVISFVKPWDQTKFFNHLCMSLGRYTTEMDVFCCGSIAEAFFRAGLLPSSTVVSRADVLVILKKYITADLAFHPISARQFSRYVQAALDTLVDVLINGAVGSYMPYMSEIMLKDQATEQLKAFETVRRTNLINGLYDDPALTSCLPTNLRDATIDAPLQWRPIITEADGVSRESVIEQSQALSCCLKAVDSFINPACRGLKFPTLVGRPGSGKSHVLKIACAYAISKGLQVELMSFTSERARKLGGNHMHLVFPLHVDRNSVTVTHSIVSDCIKRLEMDPLKLAMLKRTDVFFYEEMGLLSSHMFCALDSILQYVMQNTLPWGGKLLISSGDAKQLPPVSGQPIWSSVVMCTLMDVIVFKCDVRARDPNLRWLNQQCRRNLNATESAAVADRLLAHCTVVADWSQVPDNAVRIVSTRAAEQAVMEQFLAKKSTTDFVALDEVQNNTSWIEAVSHVTRRLDNALYEYAVCRLFVNAIVRMTYNDRRSSIQFSQGQLAIVTGLPDVSLPFSEQRLTLRLAPPGLRQIDPASIPQHWKEVCIPRRTTPPIVVGRCLQMGRRTQFPVRYHLTSTIHRIQGETVPIYATQISDTNRHYRLWQKEQLTVLISRAQQCADMIFVGSRTETRDAIINILARTSKWDNLIDNYIASLDVLSRPTVREIRLELHPFMPLYRELPSAHCGYMYLIASIADSRKCFVGETGDLKKCLREHNTGYGTAETRPTELHPWGVFAFVCGFECEDPNIGIHRRKDFLHTLQLSLDESLGPEHVYIRMREQVVDWTQREGLALVIVKCGQINITPVA